MEVHVTPETAKKLKDLQTPVRAPPCAVCRYDDLKNGRVKPQVQACFHLDRREPRDVEVPAGRSTDQLAHVTTGPPGDAANQVAFHRLGLGHRGQQNGHHHGRKEATCHCVSVSNVNASTGSISGSQGGLCGANVERRLRIAAQARLQ